MEGDRIRIEQIRSPSMYPTTIRILLWIEIGSIVITMIWS
jgi:hypothetical protein